MQCTVKVLSNSSLRFFLFTAYTVQGLLMASLICYGLGQAEIEFRVFFNAKNDS